MVDITKDVRAIRSLTECCECTPAVGTRAGPKSRSRQEGREAKVFRGNHTPRHGCRRSVTPLRLNARRTVVRDLVPVLLQAEIMHRTLDSSAVTSALVFGACLGVAGCMSNETMVCGTVGCQDQFSATVTSTDGSIPSGMHQIAITADGAMSTCTFKFPLATLSSGGTVEPECPSGLMVIIGPTTTCTTTSTDAARTQTCTPIAGHFVETITVSGKPAQVQVHQTVDGATVLDQTTSPSYQTSQPNGPGCDPNLSSGRGHLDVLVTVTCARRDRPFKLLVSARTTRDCTAENWHLFRLPLARLLRAS
jgi:hypothetical protein